jgi:hypothetical protein
MGGFCVDLNAGETFHIFQRQDHRDVREEYSMSTQIEEPSDSSTRNDHFAVAAAMLHSD